VHLRAPDFWFKLIDEYGSRFAPLGDIANIKRGITSGKDEFFFPKDCSAEQLANYPEDGSFIDTFGVPRRDVKSGKIKLVYCGEGMGEVKPIEATYLEPEVQTPMEIDGFVVSPKNCKRMILLVNKKKAKLKGTKVLGYIEWGEERDYHAGSTCKSRVTEQREWYDLTGHQRGTFFWPMAQQYKHTIPVNENHLICNHRLFDIYLNHSNSALFGGILNSSFIVLSKYQYGRPVGVEGNLDTEVIDVKMMLVPDPAKASKKSKDRVAQAFEEMKKRKALQFLSERRLREMAYCQAGKEKKLEELSPYSELDMPDRYELDDAVLKMIGVSSKAERQDILYDLYTYLRYFFEITRQKEEKAIVNKKTYRRKGPAKSYDIAEQIYQDIVGNQRHLLAKYDPDFLDRSKPFLTYDIPSEGLPEKFSDMFTSNGVKFSKGKKKIAFIVTENPAQDDLIFLLARSGLRGLVRVPLETDESIRLHDRYEKFLRQRESHVRLMIEERTTDEDMQEKIYNALMPMILQSRDK